MKIILASKSGVRKKILDKYNINNDVIVSNIDEDEVKKSLLAQKASPLIISKNLAELKSTKVSRNHPDILVLGAGGREHAICKSLKKSPLLKNLWCLPGNAGTYKLCNKSSIINLEFDNILIEWNNLY